MATGRFEFHQLRCFLAVAEELNFRKAAGRLNMTQPPLSRQIQQLEHALGLTLFERSNRAVHLTPAGKSFRSSAIDLLQRAEHAVLLARQTERGESGALILGFVPSASLEFVPRIVRALNDALPDVTFTTSEMMSYEIVEELQSGRLDFGLTRTSKHGFGIDSTHVVKDGFVVAIPRTHPLVAKTLLTPEDLDGVDYVGYATERGGFLRDEQNRLFASLGIAPKFRQRVSQTHSILALVNCGIGVGLVPATSQAMQMENLTFRPIDLPPGYASDLYLATVSARASPLRARAHAVIREALAEFAPRSVAGIDAT